MKVHPLCHARRRGAWYQGGTPACRRGQFRHAAAPGVRPPRRVSEPAIQREIRDLDASARPFCAGRTRGGRTGAQAGTPARGGAGAV